MRTLLTSLAALALLASAALAQDVTDISPASGAIGTVVTLTGSGFGTKKPSVFLMSTETGSKKYKLKVTSHSDTSIVATVLKGVAGSFDVHVKAGPLGVVSLGGFELAGPAITPGQTATADVGTSVVLDGSDFGTKKGKIAVAGKKAKVVTWTDTSVTFLVPATVSNGPVVINLSNTLGSDSIPDDLTVTGSSAPLASNKVTGSIGKKKFKPKIHFIFFTGDDWTLEMTELGKHARTLSFAIFDLGTLPAVYDGTEVTPATLTLDIAGGGGSFAGLPGAFTITITHSEDGKFAGAISGEVVGEGDETIAIEDVEFVWDTGL